MRRREYVIIGTSAAGIAALEAIRAADPGGSLAIVSRERGPAYTPMVLPYLISGALDRSRCDLRGRQFFTEMRAEVVRGRRVTRVDPRERRITFAAGGTLSFERLLIASGAEPLVPRVAGLKGRGVYVLRAVADAARIDRIAGRGSRAVIIGGGMIGMEMAEILQRRGVRVTVVEVVPQILARNFDQAAADIIRRAFEANDVRFLLGRSATGVRRRGAGLEIALDDGAQVDADFVLIAAGVKPSLGLVEGTGIRCGRGILVDDRMRTSLEGIYAAGDVAEAKDFFSEATTLNPVLPDAVEQGRVAGFNMAGRAAIFAGSINMNFMRFFGESAFSLGVFEGESVCHSFPERGGYRRLFFDDGKLVGGIFVNDDADPGVVLSLLKVRANVGEMRSQVGSRGANSATWGKWMLATRSKGCS